MKKGYKDNSPIFIYTARLQKMPRTIPTAVLFEPVECGDYHANTDELFEKFTDWAVKFPERDFTPQLEILAEAYQKFPTAIAMAKPAEPDGYTQFGFVEYPVAFPIKVAKLAK